MPRRSSIGATVTPTLPHPRALMPIDRGFQSAFDRGQFLWREGGRRHVAFIQVRCVAEAERHISRFDFLCTLEGADNISVPGIGGHPVTRTSTRAADGMRLGFRCQADRNRDAAALHALPEAVPDSGFRAESRANFPKRTKPERGKGRQGDGGAAVVRKSRAVLPDGGRRRAGGEVEGRLSEPPEEFVFLDPAA
jgi:hypothetical protein